MASIITYSATLNASTGATTGGGLSGGAFSSGGTVPLTGTVAGDQVNYGRGVVLVGVSQGTVGVAYAGAWQPVTSGTSALSSAATVIRSAEMNQRVYFLDGVNWKYYDPSDNSMHAWTATAGSLPVSNSGKYPRLICVWRGRMVLSGIEDDPHNWFMSAVSDASDWDYSPESVTPTQAVAGNLSSLGLIGNPITALMPYSDDVLIVGCDRQIWMIQGDPMAGGQTSLVSNAIGAAWGGSWCMDPYGAIYFLSNLGAIYSLVPGQAPQRISQPIEDLLADVSIDDVVVRLQWSDAMQGLHVFITHMDSAQTETHYFYEHRTGAWCQDTFGNTSYNPLCSLSFQGNTSGERVVLMGGWDGYVRYWKKEAATDDGTNISSEVLLGPLLTADMDFLLLKDVQGVLGTSSGSVTYDVLVGETAEGATAASAAVSGTWTAGRNYTSYVRRAGHAVYVRLSSTAAWAFEQIRCRIAGKGRVQKRGRNV